MTYTYDRIGNISTHSLTRRLTIAPLSVMRSTSDISTHSLTRRLTSQISGNNVEELFQLTASQGG